MLIVYVRAIECKMSTIRCIRIKLLTFKILIGSADELYVRNTAQTFDWPLPGGLSAFTRIYDGDLIKGTTKTDLTSANVSGWSEVHLCSQAFLPCFLSIEGTIHRHSESIVCHADDGCTQITVINATLKCSKNTRTSTGPLQISGTGAVLRIVSSTFSDCVSLDDGGSIRAWDGANVTISESSFENSSSQVLSMSVGLSDIKFQHVTLLFALAQYLNIIFV